MFKTACKERSVTRIKSVKSLYTSMRKTHEIHEELLTFVYVSLRNESVSIQLAQCWFPGLAIYSAEI